MVQHCATQLRRHTNQTEIMRNVPELTQNDTIQMILWITAYKVMVCVTTTLKTAVLK